VGVLWSPPPWFDDEQRAEWNWALESAPPGLLTETDRPCLVIWCVASVEHARATQEVRRVGQVVKTKEGNAILNPFMGAMNRQALMMMRAGAEMGFSPSSRAALGRMGTDMPASGGGQIEGKLAAYLAAKPDKLD
jgi:P27 family predicted phage terminase small subunit